MWWSDAGGSTKTRSIDVLNRPIMNDMLRVWRICHQQKPLSLLMLNFHRSVRQTHDAVAPNQTVNTMYRWPTASTVAYEPVVDNCTEVTPLPANHNALWTMTSSVTSQLSLMSLQVLVVNACRLKADLLLSLFVTEPCKSPRMLV